MSTETVMVGSLNYEVHFMVANEIEWLRDENAKLRRELESDAERYQFLRGHGVIFDAGRPGDTARRVFGIGLDAKTDELRAAADLSRCAHVGCTVKGPHDHTSGGPQQGTRSGEPHG